MSGHRPIEPFERLGDQLALACPYLVDVDQDEPGIHNRNRLPWSRLFLVQRSPSGDDHVGDGKARWRLRPGRILFMPANTMLWFDFEPGLRMLAFHFRLAWAGVDAFGDRRACEELADPAAVKRAYALAARCDDGDDLGAIAALRGELLALAARFVRAGPGARRRLAERARYARVLDHLDRHARADLRVEELARMMGVGREHFTRSFRAAVGLSPKRMLHRRLVERACALLMEGRKVKEVATELGFGDEFYFSRFFKARVGVAPRGFRGHLAG